MKRRREEMWREKRKKSVVRIRAGEDRKGRVWSCRRIRRGRESCGSSESVVVVEGAAAAAAARLALSKGY